MVYPNATNPLQFEITINKKSMVRYTAKNPLATIREWLTSLIKLFKAFVK